MNTKSLQIGIPVLIVLIVIGISAFIFKGRYDQTVETRKMENAVRDAARAGSEIPSADVPMNTTTEENPVEKTIALSITSPSNGTEITSPTITVRGKTIPKAEVFVNEKETVADTDGNFQVSYTLDEGENILLIVASDADGNAAETELTVMYSVTSL